MPNWIIVLNNPLLFADPWGLCAESIGETIQRQVQWQLQTGGLGKHPGELVHYTPPTPAEQKFISAYAGIAIGTITGSRAIGVNTMWAIDSALSALNHDAISLPPMKGPVGQVISNIDFVNPSPAY